MMGSASGGPGPAFSWERDIAPEEGGPITFPEEVRWRRWDRDLDEANDRLPDWAVGPFTRSADNPVLAPTAGSWDRGRFGGGVHNGSILRKDGLFHYVYRGEREIEPDATPGWPTGYICDIGLAVSEDGVHFTKDTETSPFFRTGPDRRYSFEDVSCVRHNGLYYLFCNRWYWPDMSNPATSGAFLATSPDLRTWTKHGLCFPDASRIHRNPVIVQNPENEAVRLECGFVMYLNDGLMAVSDDLIHWRSREIADPWPGGENCFALVDWDARYSNRVLVFTGGPHSGHFYAVGEVLVDRSAPDRAIEWLPRPVLAADPTIPWENGLSADPPHRPVSRMLDCIFFNGLTRHAGKWWAYYGGSEVYTCLATAPVTR
jgi:predicted GH43/DUF377 family glycosyl hydrolase